MKNSIKLLLAPALLVLWLLPINGMATSNASAAVNVATNTQISPIILAKAVCVRKSPVYKWVCDRYKPTTCYHCFKRQRGVRRPKVEQTCQRESMNYLKGLGYTCSSYKGRYCSVATKVHECSKWKNV